MTQAQKTEDLNDASLCVVVVALEETEVAACVRALRPLDVVTCPTPKDAFAEVARRRPLVVVMSTRLDETDRAAVGESCLASGSELIAPEGYGDARELGAVLLDAIRAADKRRMVQ